MVKIISDSTCDLSQELLERYDIAVLDEIYRWADENKTTPKTAALPSKLLPTCSGRGWTRALS